MSDLIATLRAIVRDEMARVRAPELGVVTQAFPRDADGNKSNHQVNLRLRESGVELQRVPVAVSRLGLSALPREGDLVLVSFVGGDLNAPIAVGCLYDDEAHPPVAQLGEVVYQPPEDEESGVRRFHLELKNGSTITVDDESLKVTLGDTALEVTKDGDVLIKAKGKIRLESQADIELEAQGAAKLNASGDLSAKGMSATVEGQSAAKLKGAQVSLAGMTSFSAS